MEIISAKYLITMGDDCPSDGKPVMDGAIAIENGEIIDVGREEDLLARYEGAVQENYSNHILMPGLINAHTHLDMGSHKNFPFDPVRSIAVEVNFVDWLLSCIDYKKRAKPEQTKADVEEGLEFLLESGTTCFADMGSYDGIFQSLEESGLRGVIFPEVVSYDSFVARDLFETALAIVDKYEEFDSDHLSVGIGPYSPYTLSRNILKIMSQYCRSSSMPVMIHVAESFSEMEFFYNSSGDIAERLFPNIGWGENLPPAFRKTPIEYLDEINFLAAQPILVGCVQATSRDLERVAKSGAKIVWCPRSNHYLKLGRAPVKEMVEKGIAVALGTDGLSSSNSLSLWDELRFAYEVAGQGEGALSAMELLKMVTVRSAAVLGIGDETGSLVPGNRADYLIVDAQEYPSGGDVYAYLIRKIKNYHIHKVVVGGRTLKRIN